MVEIRGVYKALTNVGSAAVNLGGAINAADVATILADTNALITKNVALANFPFYMVLASDGITEGTGLSVTATRSLDGGAFAACANSGTISEVSNGIYTIDLDDTDRDGDTITLMFQAAGALTRIITFITN